MRRNKRRGVEEQLPTPRTLAELTRTWRGLEFRVIEQVVGLLRTSTTLTRIDLRRTGIGLGQLEELKAALKALTESATILETDRILADFQSSHSVPEVVSSKW